MAPSNDAVFLRRNNQIQDAIDGQNLKQALQLIEKRIKKGEDTRFLKVILPTLLTQLMLSARIEILKNPTSELR